MSDCIMQSAWKSLAKQQQKGSIEAFLLFTQNCPREFACFFQEAEIALCDAREFTQTIPQEQRQLY